MASGRETAASSWLGELFRADIYKRTQGRWTRQVTAASVAAIIALGCWSLGYTLTGQGVLLSLWLPLALLLLGVWFSYRIVNWPRFADFLIAVEAEMAKVSWPSRKELWRSSLVVLITIFFLAGILFFYDFMWIQLLQAIGVS